MTPSTAELAPDLLDGGAGDDVLTDATGGDTLIGGAGNDVYAVRNITDGDRGSGAAASTKCRLPM